jgi:hypothetical protein
MGLFDWDKDPLPASPLCWLASSPRQATTRRVYPPGPAVQYTFVVSNRRATATTADVDLSFTAPAGLRAASVTDRVSQAYGPS